MPTMVDGINILERTNRNGQILVKYGYKTNGSYTNCHLKKMEERLRPFKSSRFCSVLVCIDAGIAINHGQDQVLTDQYLMLSDSVKLCGNLMQLFFT